MDIVPRPKKGAASPTAIPTLRVLSWLTCLGVPCTVPPFFAWDTLWSYSTYPLQLVGCAESLKGVCFRPLPTELPTVKLEAFDADR